MSKRRVYELAKELGVPSKELVERLKSMGVDVKSHSSTVDDDVASRLAAPSGNGGSPAPAAKAADTKPAPAAKAADAKRPAPAAKPEPKPAPRAAQPKRAESKPAQPDPKPVPKPVQPAPAKSPAASARPAGTQAPTRPAPGPAPGGPQAPPRPAAGRPASAPKPDPAPAVPAPAPVAAKVHVHRGVTVKEFADKVGKSGIDIIKALMRHGAMKSITQSMADEEILVVSEDLGVAVEIVDAEVEERLDQESEPEPSEAATAPRPPVVTVMGHVDHGKTTVLDRIREANVVAGEHGGITQHIGAYQVVKDNQAITFLDTPGHEAFTHMRARGAQVTDIAVLVVAADDGVMPQTLEAIDHARAAHVPIIVAVNKIDKEESDPTRVRTELSERGLQPQEWGGDALFVDLSAKTGQNLEDLLTGIVLVADDLDLKAVDAGPARGVVLEANLDKGRGPVATVLVQRGRLRVGDLLIAGTAWGKVRAMLDEYGQTVAEASPSRPVLVLGWSDVPEAGDEVRTVADERKARQLAQERDASRRAAENVRKPRVSLEKLLAKVDELNLILKADVQGSLEAISDKLTKLDMGEVRINVIHRSVGGITESDVSLAQASDAVIVGFNVRPDVKSRRMAETEGVEIRTYRVIYELLEEMEQALKGMLAPEFKERVLGTAEVRETFKIPRGVIAGCYVTSGEIVRNAQARLLRQGTVVYEGRIGSLRRFKDDVRTVAQNFECGIGLENFTDVKVGDVIEAFEIQEIART
ncbi:MAG TPA: translation initiation factor IF-2 [Actinomycetota bacterium]|nr:translation initiation factor IF-2 [Actinomycetota bacterium]